MFSSPSSLCFEVSESFICHLSDLTKVFDTSKKGLFVFVFVCCYGSSEDSPDLKQSNLGQKTAPSDC